MCKCGPQPYVTINHTIASIIFLILHINAKCFQFRSCNFSFLYFIIRDSFVRYYSNKTTTGKTWIKCSSRTKALMTVFRRCGSEIISFAQNWVVNLIPYICLNVLFIISYGNKFHKWQQKIYTTQTITMPIKLGLGGFPRL